MCWSCRELQKLARELSRTSLTVLASLWGAHLRADPVSWLVNTWVYGTLHNLPKGISSKGWTSTLRKEKYELLLNRTFFLTFSPAVWKIKSVNLCCDSPFWVLGKKKYAFTVICVLCLAELPYVSHCLDCHLFLDTQLFLLPQLTARVTLFTHGAVCTVDLSSSRVKQLTSSLCVARCKAPPANLWTNLSQY